MASEIKETTTSEEKEVLSAESESEGNEQESKKYSVEKIIARELDVSGKTMYYLKWKSCSDEWNTWELEENLDCAELIKEFESELIEREKNKNKKEQSSECLSLDKCTLTNLTITSGASSDSGNIKERKKSASPNVKPVPVNIVAESSIEKTEEDTSSEECFSDDSFVISTKRLTSVKKIPEKIIGATDSSGQLMYLLKWHGIEEAELIPAKRAHFMCPEIVVKFYEETLNLN